MENAINTLRIQNFKSIKDVTMEPRRVNLIIGQPNVGKSNILEAMSLLGGMFYETSRRFMGSFIRYEKISQFFYDNLRSHAIHITTDKDFSVMYYDELKNDYDNLVMPIKDYLILSSKYEMPIALDKPGFLVDIKGFIEDFENEKYRNKVRYMYSRCDEKGAFERTKNLSNFQGSTEYGEALSVKTYTYFKKVNINQHFYRSYLQPPHGGNLVHIIQSDSRIRKEVSNLFDSYGLKLLLRMDERRLEVVKDLDGVIYSYPYSSIADTLQRIIFYLAAIESNDDAVILLEEPEAHSYPVYVSMLGRRMVESRNNQFFVATHSPYLITEVLEQMLPNEQQAQELAIFVAYYEDYQTKVKQLSDEEVRAIRNDGLDVFYNMDRYVPRPVNG